MSTSWHVRPGNQPKVNSYLTLASATLSVSQSLPASGSPLSLQSRERRALSTSSFSRKRAVESTTQSEISDTDISALHPPLDNSGAEHMSLSWRRRDSTADVSSQGFRLQKCRVPELSPKKHRMRIHTARSMINKVENLSQWILNPNLKLLIQVLPTITNYLWLRVIVPTVQLRTLSVFVFIVAVWNKRELVTLLR